jgi:hypothetical protein
MKKTTTALAIALILISTAAALAQDAPLQANLRVKASGTRPVAASFRGTLQGGTAFVRGRVLNQPGGDTALVTLRFDYRIGDGIALDEIIDRIVVTIEDAAGEELAISTIDPNTINLNPNRVPLLYSTTLYTPEDAVRTGYFVRVRVFGNYE